VTGAHLKNTSSTIKTHQEALEKLRVSLRQPPKIQSGKLTPTQEKPLLSHADEELIRRAMGAKNGNSLTPLWRGDLTHKYSSQSEADLALCGQLAFWTARDSRQIDRLFRHSQLYRPKWDDPHRSDKETYGDMTIAKALETHLLTGGVIYRPAKPQSERIAELNYKHAVVMVQGKCLILNEVEDPCLGHKTITLSSPADFRNCYLNRTVKVKKKPVNLAKYWLQHPDRRQYEGLVFAPGKNVPGYYNLWKGFGVEPRPGNCDLYLTHLLENIACQDTEIYWYLIHWMAHTVQHPDQRVGVSIALRGKQGTGKGIAWKYFGNLFGPHFVHLANSRHLVGNFNAHLNQAIVVFADEAFWAGDKASEGTLKSMVTEETLPIEFKGKDLFFVKNHIHLLIASNNDWIIPAGLEERRFLTIDVGEDHIQDHAYFKAITDQMEHGGREALLHHLMDVDLTGVNLREFPQTDALMENKLLTMSPAGKFWYEKLVAGSLEEHLDKWTGWVIRDNLHEEFVKQAGKSGQSRRSTVTELGMALKRLVPGLQSRARTIDGKRIAVWEFPDLQTCRKCFDGITKSRPSWPKESTAMASGKG